MTKYQYKYKGQLLRNSNNKNFNFAIIRITRGVTDYSYECLGLATKKENAEKKLDNLLTFAGYDFTNTEIVKVEALERV